MGFYTWNAGGGDFFWPRMKKNWARWPPPMPGPPSLIPHWAPNMAKMVLEPGKKNEYTANLIASRLLKKYFSPFICFLRRRADAAGWRCVRILLREPFLLILTLHKSLWVHDCHIPPPLTCVPLPPLSAVITETCVRNP